MRQRGEGAIANVSSTSALPHGRSQSRAPAYDIAKIGVTRLATELAYLRETANVRVNCLVPDWVPTPEVLAYWEPLTPEQRKERGAPDVLISLNEIAQAAVDLATDESLAGRIKVLWCGQPPGLIPRGDLGYMKLGSYGRRA